MDFACIGHGCPVSFHQSVSPLRFDARQIKMARLAQRELTSPTGEGNAGREDASISNRGPQFKIGRWRFGTKSILTKSSFVPCTKQSTSPFVVVIQAFCAFLGHGFVSQAAQPDLKTVSFCTPLPIASTQSRSWTRLIATIPASKSQGNLTWKHPRP